MNSSSVASLIDTYDYPQDEAFVVTCIGSIGQDIIGEIWHKPITLTLLMIVIQFEMLIASNIEHTKDVPEIISETGKVGMPHKGQCISRNVNPSH